MRRTSLVSHVTPLVAIPLMPRPMPPLGLLTMYRTLRAVSSYPLIVMVTDTLPESSRNIIRRTGIDVVPVAHITPALGQHPGFDPTFVRLNDAWTKLRIFGLTEYDRLVLIDSDMIFLRGMDEVFDLELPGDDWIGAAPACVCNPLKLAHYPKDW
jgi:alpha-N-acetylglucosamine transferase